MPNNNKSGDLGFEATLWATADKLRGNLDAAEYKHVVLGLIFLKYISDAFAEKHAALKAEKGADPEDRDEYLAENIFWVPQEARWSFIQGLANPPFNMSDWGGDRLRDDARGKYGAPPVGNANFAWVQHFIHHLAPTGTAGFVLANGSMSSNQSGEGDIRKTMVEADLVDCMVALPGQLFYSTQIPVCLWFLTKSKAARKLKHAKEVLPEFIRNRCAETLFIDARKMGTLIDRVHRELTEDDIDKIVETYSQWQLDTETMLKEADKRGIIFELAPPYQDIPGFCKSATTAEIAGHGHVLTPGRYVGAEEAEDDGDLIPNQAVLINAIPLQEAKLSSEIENIVTTQDALFQAALDESRVTDPATKEVLRYRTALRRGFEAVQNEPFRLNLLEELCGVLRHEKVKFRADDRVYIGNPAAT